MKTYVFIFEVILVVFLLSYISYDVGYQRGCEIGEQYGKTYMQQQAISEGHAEWHFNGQNTEFRWICPHIDNVDTSIMETV